MKRLSNQGFSMIELLVVLLIIGILAAVAAPFFLQNSDKAKVSEAVTILGSIRSAERNWSSQNNGAFLAPITDSKNYFGTNGTHAADLGVTIHAQRYFSPAAFTVVAVPVNFTATGVGAAQDFLIKADGSQSQALVDATSATDDGARSNGEVNKLRVEMDNSGIAYFSTDSGNNWSKF